MIEFLVTFLESTVLPLGGWGVFLACLIEEIIAPIPSAFVLAGSGALFLPPAPSFLPTLFFTIVIPASLGITLGSMVVFGGAYWLGKPFIARFGKWFGLSWEEVEKVRSSFTTGWKDETVIFLLRTIPLVPSVVISASAGVLRIPFYSYMGATFLGTLIRATVIALIGWGAGETYFRYAESIGRIENTVLVLFFVLLSAWIVRRRMLGKRRSVIQ